MNTCASCESQMSEEWTRNPVVGVDNIGKDWIYNYTVQLCPECWDHYCVKNDVGTLEDALENGVRIVFYPYD